MAPFAEDLLFAIYEVHHHAIRNVQEVVLVEFVRNIVIIGDIWVKDSKLSFDQFWHDVHFHGPKLQVLFLLSAFNELVIKLVFFLIKL